MTFHNLQWPLQDLCTIHFPKLCTVCTGCAKTIIKCFTTFISNFLLCYQGWLITKKYFFLLLLPIKNVVISQQTTKLQVTDKLHKKLLGGLKASNILMEISKRFHCGCQVVYNGKNIIEGAFPHDPRAVQK